MSKSETKKRLSRKGRKTMQHQSWCSVAQIHRPTKLDLLVVTGMAVVLMGVLSLAMYGACAQMHAGSLAWLVLLVIIWLPGSSMLVLFAFSRWPDTDRKQRDPEEQEMVDTWNNA